MASPIIGVKFESRKADGTNNAGGKVFTYAAGTTTPQVTYTSASGLTPNPNPVILDGTGRAFIYINPALAYKFVCTDANDVPVPDGTVDNITDPVGQLAGAGGAGLIGYSVSSTYTAGTVGAKLQETISVFDYMTAAEIADVKARTKTLNVAVAVQTFLNACRGRRGYMPAGTYRCDNKLSYDPEHPTHVYGDGYNSDATVQGTVLEFTDPLKNGLEIIYAYAQWAPGGGADAHTQYDIANGITPKGNSDNRVVFEGFRIKGPGATTTAGSQSIQLYGVGPETMGTGNGVFAYWANNLLLKDLWVDEWPAVGFRSSFCFASRAEGGYYVKNRSAGIVAESTSNAFTLEGVRCIGNGRKSGPFASFNCLIGGDRISYGVEVTGDFEGAGFDTETGYFFSEPNGTLTSITVASGIATATFTTAPAFLVNDWIGVTNGADTGNKSLINSAEPAIVLSKVGNTITFATDAPDGTYADGTGKVCIGPYVCGLGLKNVYGADVNHYTEATVGPSVYVYGDCRGVVVNGSTLNDGGVFCDGYFYGVGGFVAAAGTGYAVNNILTIVGGDLDHTGGSVTTIKVTGVGGSGEVTSFTIETAGRYRVPPSDSATVTGGAGSGAQITINWQPEVCRGVVLQSNAFAGPASGVKARSEQSVTLIGNRYQPTATGTPKLKLGYLIESLDPLLQETGAPIAYGVALASRGINQFFGSSTPGHYSNWASGLGALNNIQDVGNGTGTGRQNTAFGTFAGKGSTSGYNNTLGGFQCGLNLATGTQVTAYGSRCFEDNTNAQAVTVMGYFAGKNIISGGNMTLFGVAAGQVNTAMAISGFNSFFGTSAGRQSSSQDITQCTIVGEMINLMSLGASLTNYTSIGYDTQQFFANNKVRIGNASVTAAHVQVAWTITSDSRFKENVENLNLGVEFLKQLRPVSYNRIGTAINKREMGFIAQEVEDELPTGFGMVEVDGTGTYGMRSQDLIAVLVKAVQELAARVEQLENP